MSRQSGCAGSLTRPRFFLRHLNGGPVRRVQRTANSMRCSGVQPAALFGMSIGPTSRQGGWTITRSATTGLPVDKSSWKPQQRIEDRRQPLPRVGECASIMGKMEYAALFEPAERAGSVITNSDSGWSVSQGGDEEEACEMAGPPLKRWLGRTSEKQRTFRAQHGGLEGNSERSGHTRCMAGKRNSTSFRASNLRKSKFAGVSRSLKDRVKRQVKHQHGK